MTSPLRNVLMFKALPLDPTSVAYRTVDFIVEQACDSTWVPAYGSQDALGQLSLPEDASVTLTPHPLTFTSSRLGPASAQLSA